MIRSTILAAMENAVLLIGKAIALLLFTWLVGAEAQGLFTLFLATYALATTLVLIGFDTTNNYFQARSRSRRTKAGVLGNTLLVTFVLGIVSVLALASLNAYTDIFITFEGSLFILLMIATPMGTLSLLTGAILFGSDRFGTRLTGTCLHNVIFIAGMGKAALDRTLTAESGILWWATGLFICTLYWLASAWRDIEGPPFIHVPTLKRQFRYAIKAYPYFVMSAANYRLDNFIIAGFLGLRALGIYSVAVASVEVFLYISRSLSNVTLTYQASDLQASAANVLQPLVGVLIAILPLAVLGPPIAIMVFFSEEFRPAALIAIILLPGIYAMAAAVVGSYTLFARARNIDVSLATGLGMVVTIVANLTLLPLIGIYGAAIATSLSYGVFCFYVLRSIVRTDKMPLLSLIRPDWAVLHYLLARLGLQRSD